MTGEDWTSELRSLSELLGTETRFLRIGPWLTRLDGLDLALATRLDERWGPFVGPASDQVPDRTIHVLRGGPQSWLPAPARGEVYRVEAEERAGGTVVRSYHFALCPESQPGAWRCGLVESPNEPLDRAFENAVRCVLARLAVEEGGFALHGAGVLRNDLAWIFAGPSRSGKTTAVSLSAPGLSLGDDFAIVVPTQNGWMAAAVPFDNLERPPAAAPEDLVPLAGIFRLFQDTSPRVEAVPMIRAVSSLLSCAAMSPTMPDLATRLLENIERFVTTGRYAHLYFRKSPDFWEVLEASLA